MAKKKGIQVDFKELGLKYGDRLGVGIAAILALLFVVWGFSSVSSNPLTPTEVKTAKDAAQVHMRNYPVQPEKLEPANADPAVKRTDDIDRLSQSKKKEILIGSLATMFNWYYQPPKENVARSMPDVLAVMKLSAKPQDFAYKITDVQGGNVLIAVPKEAVKIKIDKDKDKDRLRGGGGLGGMADVGAGPQRSGAGRPNPGGAAATGPKQAWMPKYIPRGDLKDEDILAVNIWPARAAYIVGIFPYAKQVDELASKLKLERTQVESYFADLQVQRREIVLKGTWMPDGSIASQDLVVVPDAANPGKFTLKPFTEVAQNPVTDDEARAAGWTNLNKEEQIAMTRWAKEAYEEPDGIMGSLIKLSDRLSRRIPKPLRGDYPEMQDSIPELKDLIEKIRKDNTPIVKPRSDPRLDPDRDNQFDGPVAPPAAGRASGTGPGAGLGAMGATPPPPAGTAPPPPGGSKPAPGETPKTDAPTQMTAFPDWCVVRFVDLTLGDERQPVGGRTFEYRVRVVMNNPNYRRVDVAVPIFAKDKELFGSWSPSTRVTFPAPYFVYADERVRDAKKTGPDPMAELDRVPVQVHRWIGFFDAEAGGSQDAQRMGEWWVERLLASRGEFIGRVPTHPKTGEATLVTWLPATPEDNDPNKMGSETLEKFRTPSLMTPSLLVDFEGGARLGVKRLAGRTGQDLEEVPAELLIVDGEGKLTASSYLVHRDDQVRKHRFDRWQAWFNAVKDKVEKQKPPPPPKEEPKPAKPSRPGGRG